MQPRPQILLTNDDGIQSPGLWAAAAALEQVGFVHVVAPKEQSTGMGRSLPGYASGVILPEMVEVNDKEWTVYSVDGSPAQAVIHGVLEILPEPPHLVVSGINYGENFGTGVTISGTVGAAMEGAGLGVPSLAVSLEVDKALHLSYSEDIDFGPAAYFTAMFAEMLLEKRMPPDVDLLKLEIPAEATTETGWELSRLSRKRYYESLPPRQRAWGEPGQLDYQQSADLNQFPKNSDVYITRVAKKVAVTPLSLDLTSRVDMDKLAGLLRG